MKNDSKGYAFKRSQLGFVYSFLVPIMLFFIVFNIIPIITNIVLSFYNYSPLSKKPPFIGFSNYIKMFNDEVFIKSIWNTLKFVIFAVSANIIVATGIAVTINSLKSKFSKETFRTIFFLPTIAPIAGISVIWMYMLDPSAGIHNLFLQLVGQNKLVYWLSDPSLAMLSIIIMTVWQDFGINMVIILAGIYGIPKTFFEAAAIDGANKWKQFWIITLPLLVRTMLFVTVMTVISYFQVFTQVKVMTNGEPGYSTQVISLSIYQDAFERMRMGYASAMSVVLLIIIMVVSVAQFKLIKIDWDY